MCMLIQKIVLVDGEEFERFRVEQGIDFNFSAWVREKISQEMHFLSMEPLDRREIGDVRGRIGTDL